MKKAGTFLDGCKIFLSGFTNSEEVQLGRVLKFGGAVRLSQVVESISHCVHSLDTPSLLPQTARLLASLPDVSPHQVSVQWLVQSFKLGRPAPEADFTFPPVTSRDSRDVKEDPSQPMPPLLPPSSRAGGSNDLTEFDRILLGQFSRAGNISRSRTGNLPPSLPPSLYRYNSCLSPEDVSQILPFLAGKKLNIAGFDEETAQVRTEVVM